MSAIRIRRVIARQGRLETAAARAQRRLIATLRREVLAELVEATGFRRWQLSQVLAAIDRFVAEGRAAAERAASNAVTDAWQLGIDMAEAGVGARGAHLAGLSRELLDAIRDVVMDQVRDVWRELGSRLKATVRRVTLGVDDPFKAMQKLTTALRDRKTFSDKFTRAETIVRTEVNRTFSVAQQKRLEQAAAATTPTGDKILKWWLTAEDDRVRDTPAGGHVAAGERYSKDKAIPVSEPFVVGGEKLMYPLDPSGSAWNTINCRCASVPVVMEA